MCDNPATAFKEKKDSSLTVGLNLLKNGDGAAFVSAGSTGALLSAATLMVKRIRGIRRAAMAPVVPTGGGGAVLIDCGATAEGTPEYLLQFAFMGSYYAEPRAPTSSGRPTPCSPRRARPGASTSWATWRPGRRCTARWT